MNHSAAVWFRAGRNVDEGAGWFAGRPHATFNNGILHDPADEVTCDCVGTENRYPKVRVVAGHANCPKTVFGV